VVLLRSLPEAVKNYILHHSSADTYESYRNAAMRREEQHRLFNDFEVSGKKVNALESSSSGNTEYYSLEEWGVDTVAEGLCAKCGSRRHGTGSCTVDVTKVKCFRCGKQDMSVAIVLLARQLEKERAVRKENRDL